MDTPPERFVPKVHPATRPVEADDPLALCATSVSGDPEVMLECLVQEYAWMGWGVPQILRLFGDPGYPALNGLLDHYGIEGVRRRVAAVLGRMGVFRVSGTVRDDPEPEDDEPELIDLGTRRVLVSKGDSHAQGV
jgi:hypothetical protein